MDSDGAADKKIDDQIENVPIEPLAATIESAGTTTIESKKVTAGEPWTLAGDREHNSTTNESDVSQYLIPLDPVKLHSRQDSGGDGNAAEATTGRRESNGGATSGDESVGSKEEETVASEVYVRPDGKKVRKVKRRSLEVDESLSVGSASVGEIYIRSDGKKVRRVKKKKPKTTEAGTTEFSQLPMTPLEEDEEFFKESTVEPSDGKPSLALLQDALYSDCSQFKTDVEETSIESRPLGQVDNPSVAGCNDLATLPSKDNKLQEINPWMMDPMLEEEASHRSNRSFASHLSIASRRSVEAKNPFDTPIATLDADVAAPDAVNPFDTLMRNSSPPMSVDEPREVIKSHSPPMLVNEPRERLTNISPPTQVNEARASTSTRNTPAFNTPDQGFPYSTRNKDEQNYGASDSLTLSPRQAKPIVVVSDDAANNYVNFDMDGNDVHDIGSSAERDVNSPHSTSSRKSGSRQPLPESFMVRTRSRADPNAVVASPPRNPRASLTIRVSADDDAFILNTALARKRIRVVQLLIVGLLGFLLGFLGNVFIQSSCHFATAKVAVGTNGQVFRLHYGLWKFTPLDSVFQGYTYCYNYHDRFTGDAPLIPRLAGLSAMLLGGYSLCNVWYYLIFGDADEIYWRWCVRTAIAAGMLQFMTMFFFVDDVCRNNECAFGPAGIVSLTSAVMWLVLAFELWYNMPMSAWAPDIGDLVNTPDASLMGNLEMSDFEDGAKAYFRRMRPNHDLPTLNQRQRENENPIGEGMREFSVSPRGTYIPPLVDL